MISSSFVQWHIRIEVEGSIQTGPFQTTEIRPAAIEASIDSIANQKGRDSRILTSLTSLFVWTMGSSALRIQKQRVGKHRPANFSPCTFRHINILVAPPLNLNTRIEQSQTFLKGWNPFRKQLFLERQSSGCCLSISSPTLPDNTIFIRAAPAMFRRSVDRLAGLPIKWRAFRCL